MKKENMALFINGQYLCVGEKYLEELISKYAKQSQIYFLKAEPILVEFIHWLHEEQGLKLTHFRFDIDTPKDGKFVTIFDFDKKTE